MLNSESMPRCISHLHHYVEATDAECRFLPAVLEQHVLNWPPAYENFMCKVVVDDTWLAFLQGRKLTEREGACRGEQTHTHLVHIAVARLYARPAAANGPLHPAKAPEPGMGAKSGAWAGASSGAREDRRASLPGGGSGADSEALAEERGNGQGIAGLRFEGLDAEALAEFGGAAEAARQLAGAPGREATRCLLAVLLGCLLAPVRCKSYPLRVWLRV